MKTGDAVRNLFYGPISERLVQPKRVQDLTTSTLMQRTLDAYVSVGRYQRHLRRSIRIYHRRWRKGWNLRPVHVFSPIPLKERVICA